MASTNNMKVNIEEYERIAKVYLDLQSDIESSTERFFGEVRSLTLTAMMGKTAINLRQLSDKVQRTLKGDMGKVMLEVYAAITISIGYVPVIELSDKFK